MNGQHLQSNAISYILCKVHTELENMGTISLNPVLWMELKEPEPQAYRQIGAVDGGCLSPSTNSHHSAAVLCIQPLSLGGSRYIIKSMNFVVT